jgi:hypothetical protein
MKFGNGRRRSGRPRGNGITISFFSICFEDDVADSFRSALATLCEESPAVLIALRSGEELGAVLISVNDEVLVFEHWDSDKGIPSEDLATLGVMDISEVTVY